MKTLAEEEGLRLKALLDRLDLTQTEFAEQLGRKLSIVNKYCKGKLRIPTEAIRFLYDKYDMNISWFYLGTGKMINHEKAQKTTVTDVKQLKQDMEHLNLKLLKYIEITDKLVRKVYSKE
ncbi:transcriptional regulator with XRE-family HTH domain [Pedobacter sp. AK013]|uniref:helix-turn-helix domain-containing protein n=1 Tax=Pedobacter sp. AK013 TaxID=2723071 RepID=UPI00161391C4|nr:helix-turn-helix transcriptional regulator [Pedobacter sp. AK013]MBB6236545.1 transcriptional regulator with XRE-family HTH domain [Pedobacter sp. AK013]